MFSETAVRKFRFLAYALGIILSYAIYGILQEKIFKSRYGNEKQSNGKCGENFTYAVAFTAFQTFVFTIFSKSSMLIKGHEKNVIPQKYYYTVAIFYVTAMVTSNAALQYIAYSAQVVVKASKPIPVMILGVLIAKKSYAIQKYFFVLMMVVGVGFFIFNDNAKHSKEEIWIGYVIIGVSLVMDGLTGAAQEKLRAFAKPTTINFMFYVNGWSSMLLICLMAATGDGRDLIKFATNYPEIIWKLIAATAFGTIGQIFISAMITHFGSLALSITTTTRKSVTVFISSVLIGNSLSERQWLAIVLIFSALLLDSVFGKTIHNFQGSQEKSQFKDETRIENFPTEIIAKTVIDTKEKSNV